MAASKLASVCAASSKRAPLDGLLEAPGEDARHALQAVVGLGVGAVGDGRGAVVEQGVVAGGLGEAPLVHRQARLLEQLIDLALDERGLDHRCGGKVQAQGAAPFARGFAGEFLQRVRVEAETVATAIRIGDPASWDRAVRSIRYTDGVVLSVTDAEILAAKQVIDHAGSRL